MKPNTLHLVRSVFLYGSLLFLGAIDLIWCMVKEMSPVFLPVIFLAMIVSVSLRAFTHKRRLALILLSDFTLIILSYWSFTHRPWSWMLDHLLMEPTPLITSLAIVFVVSDWFIQLRRKKTTPNEI